MLIATVSLTTLGPPPWAMNRGTRAKTPLTKPSLLVKYLLLYHVATSQLRVASFLLSAVIEESPRISSIASCGYSTLASSAISN